ncbi:hypothetical protein [Paenibacillus sp. FSL K6-1230]|uniref:hypothetical protein n=1 Tax=Paenibacillus sp. FSL K6-1230 TaxID=2921603 RepID=UPI0030FB67AC
MAKHSSSEYCLHCSMIVPELMRHLFSPLLKSAAIYIKTLIQKADENNDIKTEIAMINT